jgi:hypothetical protein
MSVKQYVRRPQKALVLSSTLWESFPRRPIAVLPNPFKKSQQVERAANGPAGATLVRRKL